MDKKCAMVEKYLSRFWRSWKSFSHGGFNYTRSICWMAVSEIEPRKSEWMNGKVDGILVFYYKLESSNFRRK